MIRLLLCRISLVFFYRNLLFVLYLLSHTVSANILHGYQQNSQSLFVVEDNGLRCLFVRKDTLTDHTLRGCLYPIQPLALANQDKQLILSGLLVHNNPKRILIIGLGTGSLTMALHHALPMAYIETVENNPKIIDLAKRFFDFKPNAMLPTYAVDGRDFVNQALSDDIHYDMIVIDQYYGLNEYKHLMTTEFLTSIKQLLTSQGIIVVNAPPTISYDQLSATYYSVFGEFFNIKTSDGKHRIILATNDHFPETATIRNNALTFAKLFWQDLGINVNDLLTLMDKTQDWDMSVEKLTDKSLPFTSLPASHFERYILFYKNVLKNHFMLTILATCFVTILFILVVVKLFDGIASLRNTRIKQTYMETK